MATKNSTGTLKRVDHPTAPLPAPAVQALARLELRLTVPADVVAAVARHTTAAVRAASLADLADAGYTLSPLEWDDLAHAEDLMAGAKATLAAAGRLDLIGVA